MALFKDKGEPYRLPPDLMSDAMAGKLLAGEAVRRYHNGLTLSKRRAPRGRGMGVARGARRGNRAMAALLDVRPSLYSRAAGLRRRAVVKLARTAIWCTVAAGMTLLAAALSACGSDEATSENPGDGQPAGPEAITPLVSQGTPVDADSVELEEDTGALDSYTIGVPKGWVFENQPLPGGFARRYVLMKNGGREVVFQVRCTVDATVEQMMWQDQAVVTSLGGSYDASRSVEREVLGVPATQVDYELDFITAPVEQRAVYFVSKPCGWRVVLQGFGQGTRNRYADLFERVLSTFRPAEFEVPFEHRDPYRPYGSPTAGP